MTDINWDEPIEAVHEDGRVVRVELIGGPDSDGDYKLAHPLEAELAQARYFRPDGTQSYNLSWGKEKPWRIRNVAKPEVEPVGNSEQLPPALVARMVALVRKMGAASKDCAYSWDRGNQSSRDYDEARAIVNDPGFPAEVDEDLREAREIARAVTTDNDWARIYDDQVIRGEHDDSAAVRAALAAIRRGRVLATRAAGEREVG